MTSGEGTKELPGVLYLLGSARCGSTIFAHFAGSHSDVTHLGELKVLAERAWVQPEYCSCGALGSECLFWSGVRDDLRDSSGDGVVERLSEAQSRYDRLRRALRIVSAAGLKTAGFREYESMMNALFRSLHRRTGSRVILDSSKSPARAYSLRRSLGKEPLFFVHLVRDPRAVVWSLSKSYEKNLEMGINRDMRPHGVGRASLSWSVPNVLGEWIGRRDPSRYLRVRYEDFVRSPESTLRDVYGLLGMEEEALPEDRSFGSSHVIAGNRVRMQGRVRLRMDDDWKTKMPDDLRVRVWRLTAWLAKRYGYEA